MIAHDEARVRASARADGELGPSQAPELDEHLGGCARCRAFASALPGLSALAAALPREHAPSDLARRVASRLPGEPSVRKPRRAGRRGWRLTPALAAALVVTLVIVVAGRLAVIPVPSAAAAEALVRLRTFSISREIRDLDPATGAVTATTSEHIWFRAPADVRTERTVVDSRGTTHELVIERPGVRYLKGDDYAQLETGLPPSTALLPQPLSPTIALIGNDAGPGPVVAGRATRRFEVTFGEEKVIASVDAQTFSALGADEVAVLNKGTLNLTGRVLRTKRTLSIRYNEPIPDGMFRIPRAPAFDYGFRARSLEGIPLAPAATPQGFGVVSAVAGPGGAAILYARGAMPILVTIDGTTSIQEPSRVEYTRVGRLLAELRLGLYDLPTLRFTLAGFNVAVSAPLPEAQLVELARRLYPQTER
jgi:anti-sigma factor RsiW